MQFRFYLFMSLSHTQTQTHSFVHSFWLEYLMHFPHICKPLLLVQVKKILSLTLSSIILSMLSVINILKLWCNFFSAARMHNCFQTNTKYLRIVVLQSIYFNHIGIYYFSVEEKNKMLKSGKKTKRKILNWIKVELNEIVIKISDISVKWNKKRAYIRKPKINKKSGLKLLLTLIIQGHMFEPHHSWIESTENGMEVKEGKIRHQLAKPKPSHLFLQNEHFYFPSPRSNPPCSQFIHLELFGFSLLLLVKLDTANIFLPLPLFRNKPQINQPTNAL